MEPIIGFTTGQILKIGFSLNQGINFLKDLGCSAIEFGYVRKERLDKYPIDSIDIKLLDGFNWVSVHAPGSTFNYSGNEESKSILEGIERIHKKRPLDMVVFHPDSFDDFSILDDYSFPIGIENMDNRKVSFQDADSLSPIFNQQESYNFILDVNHVYTNDKTMKLANDLFIKFKDRLKEVHLSGYEQLHDPLFVTKQKEIIAAVPVGNFPIIIESKLADVDSVKNEYRYVLDNLSLL